MCGCLSCAPPLGTDPQPRQVPWLQIKLATLWFTSQHSVHWATPSRAQFYSFCFISFLLDTVLCNCIKGSRGNGTFGIFLGRFPKPYILHSQTLNYFISGEEHKIHPFECKISFYLSLPKMCGSLQWDFLLQYLIGSTSAFKTLSKY